MGRPDGWLDITHYYSRMTNEKIIHSANASLGTLLRLLEKKIEFTEITGDGEEVDIEPHKFKGIVDGRKQVFDDARYHITQIKQMEDADGVKDVETNYRKNLQRLIDSSETMMTQIDEVLYKEIQAEESGDDKVKLISQSKTLSLDMLMNVFALSNEIKIMLSSKKSLTNVKRRDIVTDRVKNKGGGR